MTEIRDIKDLKNDPELTHNILGKILQGSATSPNAYDRLMELLNTLRDDLVVVVEYDYVDSMYRDEYYRFYATKYHTYLRNCARMSFFESGALVSDCSVDYSRQEEIVWAYLGFVVLRPLDACIGRNVIDPRAKMAGLNDFSICKTMVKTSALGLKVEVCGFPHSSQDGEMMTCAETALWAIAEYYGHKYVNYKPVSPTEILEAMRPSSFQRQLPSRGLTFEQISIALKTFGFYPEVYRLWMQAPVDTTKLALNYEMKEVLSCYIESGFPLALCLQSDTIGHAVVCVGRGEINSTLTTEVVGGMTMKFCNQSVDEIILNDDNVPCYQKAKIAQPATYYRSKEWDDVKITSFLVPLPSKVYMDAYLAIKQTKMLLCHVGYEGAVVKTYLASCRSYRNHVATSIVVPNEVKNVLLNIDLPRFIWVTEIAPEAEYKSGIVTGLIILDATNLDDQNTNSIILYVNDNKGFAYNNSKSVFNNMTLPGFLRVEQYNKNIN